MKAAYMKKGNLYKVTYKQQAGNYRWTVYEMTAVYLGERMHDKEMDFSLRPVMGTTSLPRDMILDVTLVMKNVPRAYRDGIRDRGVPVKPSRRVCPLDKWVAQFG
jgi:hypothetical protein